MTGDTALKLCLYFQFPQPHSTPNTIYEPDVFRQVIVSVCNLAERSQTVSELLTAL